MFNRFSRRQGKAVAAAALSVTLIASAVTPAAHAQGSSPLTTVANSGSSEPRSNESSAKDGSAAAPSIPVDHSKVATPADDTFGSVWQGNVPADSQKCIDSVIGFGIPLAALVPFALASQLGIGGLESLNEQFNEQIRQANTELQRQAGILNPEIARQVESIDRALENYGLNLTSALLGVATTAAAIGAAVSIIGACAPQGGSSEAGSSRGGKTSTPKTTSSAPSTATSAPSSASSVSSAPSATSTTSATTTPTSAAATTTSSTTSSETTTTTTTAAQ